MALVSQNIVHEWFKKDSWVYKGFAYLFQNKLWSKRVPSGFSLCPYFWLSLFSIVLFKPALEPAAILIKALLKGIMKVGGWPLAKLDRFVKSKINCPDIPGFGILAAILMLACLVAISFILYLSSIKIIEFHKSHVIRFYFALMLVINLISIGVTIFYREAKKYDENRCRVEWYSVVILFLTYGTLMYLFPSVTKDFSIVVLYVPVVIAVAVFKWLSVAITFCGHYLAIGLKYAWLAIVFASPFCLWALAITVAMGFVYYLSIKLFDIPFSVKAVPPLPEEKTVSEEKWRRTISMLLQQGYDKRIIMNALPSDCLPFWVNKRFRKEAELEHNLIWRRLFSQVVDLCSKNAVIPPELLKMTTDHFALSMQKYFKSKQQGFNYFSECVDDYSEDCPNQDSKSLAELIVEMKHSIFATLTRYGEDDSLTLNPLQLLIQDYRKELNSLAKKIDKRNKAYEATLSKRSKMCHSISDPIASFFSFIFIKIIWKSLIVAPSKAIWFVMRQIGILFAYLWIVVKHMKQGACPYMMFEDPTTNVNAKSAEIK